MQGPAVLCFDDFVQRCSVRLLGMLRHTQNTQPQRFLPQAQFNHIADFNIIGSLCSFAVDKHMLAVAGVVGDGAAFDNA